VIPSATAARLRSPERAPSRVPPLIVTTVYILALAAVSGVLSAMGPQAREVAVSRMSTNLHNLAHGHLTTLVGSAFVTEGDIWFSLPGLVCLLALGEQIWRSRGLLLAFAVGHIGATLIVAAGLTAAIGAGWLPTSIAYASDVGISYGAVGVVGALTASIPARWRPSWIGWWLGATAGAAVGADFAAYGHIAALLLGMALSTRLRSEGQWTFGRAVLLAVAGVFGFLMVAGSSPLSLIGGIAGALLLLPLGLRRKAAQEFKAPCESGPPGRTDRRPRTAPAPASRSGRS
jgi:hypothetical protein